MSDHLPQILLMPSMFSDIPATKSNIFERQTPINAEFVMDHFDKDWSKILNLK